MYDISQFSDMCLQSSLSPEFQTPASPCALSLPATLTWHRSKLELVIFLPKELIPFLAFLTSFSPPASSPLTPHHYTLVSSSFQSYLESTLTSHPHRTGSGLPVPGGILESALASPFNTLKGQLQYFFLNANKSKPLFSSEPFHVRLLFQGGAGKGQAEPGSSYCDRG